MTQTPQPTPFCPGSGTRHADIECASFLIPYLRKKALIDQNDCPKVQILAGGISNKTVLVEPGLRPPFVVKQALTKLRVAADWYSDPSRIHREALGLRYLEELAPAETTTPLIFEDTTQHIIAMKAVPREHRNWKAMLLSEGPKREHILQFAEIIGAIHHRSFQNSAYFDELFHDQAWFESLRLEAYYEYTGTQLPNARQFLEELLRETRQTRIALVHGDYSPKNILVHNDHLVLLDHEVIHFGDPAFDIGFSVTHLLSKSNHCEEMRQRFLECAKFYVSHYADVAQARQFGSEFEGRACRHTLACLLARVAGRSPLEYLGETERDRQKEAVLSLMRQCPDSLAELIDCFEKEIACS
jgi:5-methylthioribose kinase